MADEHASHPTHAAHGAHAGAEAGPSRSVTYAGFALLAILFVAVIAYSYTQFAAVQQQLNRVAPAADRLAGVEARMQQLEALVPKPAQFQLLYDSSCAFCDNEQLLSDARDYNYENEPKGIKLVPSDVKDKLDLVKNASIPYLPLVLVLEPEARRNAFSWDLVRQEGLRGPVFIRIPGGWYGGLSTDGQPRPAKLVGESCQQAGKLTVDYFYGLRCPFCASMKDGLDAYKNVLGDSLVVREHCLPSDADEVKECVKREGADAANQTEKLSRVWGVGSAPTTVFDCAYSQSSASLAKMTDRLCLIRPELCDTLRKAGGAPAPGPEAGANATNSTGAANVTGTGGANATNATR